MGVLLWLGRTQKKLKDGDLFLFYLIIYPIGRFLLEFLRLDQSMVGGVNANQVTMLVVALLSAGTLIWRHRSDFQKQAAQTDEETLDEAEEENKEDLEAA